MHLDIGCVTSRGGVRDTNEDAAGAVPDAGLVVVSDGIGGAACGEVASRLTVAAIKKVVAAAHANGGAGPAHLARAIRYASEVVTQAGANKPGCRGMGATATALLLSGHQVAIHWVGDSPAYRVNRFRIDRLTVPHANGHGLERWIGMGRVKADAHVEPARNGATYVLATDGLSNVLEPSVIHSVVASAWRDGTKAMARALVDEVLRRGAPDNVTVAVVRVIA